MKDIRCNRRATRAGVAILSATLLAGGYTWHSYAADAAATAPAPQTTTASPSVASRIPANGRDSYADIVKVVAPAVVTVRVEGKARATQTQFQGDEFFRRFFGDEFGGAAPRVPRSFRGLGSGVVISNDGYIVTNNHVVDDANDIRVEFAEGRTLTAKVVGTDKASDLALIKVNASALHSLTLGDSDAVQVGDVVLAVGNPLGVGQSVTMGIISAKSRSTGVGDGSYEDFLQTDAPINHGNSGGALVNMKGELIGINSQIMSGTGENIGIGFAIPAKMARHVVDQLRTNGKVTRAQLGVVVQPVTSDMAQSLGLKETKGAIVASVTAGSPADAAGIKQGDVIVSFNGQPARDSNALRNQVAETKPGSTADIVIVRDGAERHVAAKLGEANPERTARAAESGESNDASSLGISVAPVTPEVASRLGLSRNAQGLVIEDVDPDGRAADSGLQAGDVIQQANRQPVRNVEQLRTAVRQSSDRPLLLLINRQGRDLFVTVRPNA